MAESAQQVYDEICVYMGRWDNPYPNWYSGITSDPQSRLFNDHNVSIENDAWIYRRCTSNDGARSVGDALLKLGCNGLSGSGDEISTYIYSYLKSANTKPQGK